MEIIESIPKKTRNKIPEHLIYEMVDGRPIYYAGYQNVVKGIVSSETIMGAGKLQSYIIRLIQKFLDKHSISDVIELFYSEVGIKFPNKTWRNCDLAIFKKERLVSEDLFDEDYFTTPPNVVIEIDTKADLKNYDNEEHYYREKTQQLLDFGVEKVIWIYTKNPRKILVAENGKDWLLKNWNKDVEIMPDCLINLQDLIDNQ
ncbi:MAG: Uma2 family endonuclease [Spirosomaceae bacterium]|jgi:Uma2 family endonuclease|nr:Uma2 family endonuclease [Spirosomataceae bacterium]